MSELRGLPQSHQPSRRRSATQTALFVGGAALALVVGSVAVSAQPSHKPGFRVDDNIGILRAAAVVTDLQQRGVIDRPDEVLSVSSDAIGLKGDATGPAVTDSAARTKGGSGGGTKGGGKNSTGGGGTTVTIGGGSTTLAGSSTSYALLNGPGLLTGYTITAAAGTPSAVVDGLSAAAADSAAHSGSPLTWGQASAGSEPLNGEIRISSWDSQICGSDQAAGCTTTWYDGARVLKAEIRIRTWVDPSYARCVVEHELGHGLGLAHVNDSTQVMNPVLTVGVSPCSYQAGDAGGLAMMGSVKSTL